MNFLIQNGLGSGAFKSLSYQTTRDSWDTVGGTILHRSTSVSQVRALYPRLAAVPLGLGFYVAETQIRPAQRLPGVVMADVSLIGAFDVKLVASGASSAHSESPSNVKIPQLSATLLFQKTDILVAEPTFEVLALDNIRPDLAGVGKSVTIAYSGVTLPTPPENPFNFTGADVAQTRTVRFPWGWCFLGVEYERISNLWLKRYYYAYRHLVTP